MLAKGCFRGTGGFATRRVAPRSMAVAPVLRFGVPQQRLLMQAARQGQLPLAPFAFRGFSDASAVMSQDGAGDEVDTRDENARLGVDVEFSQQKHAYVLTFPWNFDEIIDEFQGRYRPMTGYWATFVNNSGAIYEFNNLFREFHQMCAQHDAKGVQKVCEGRLAQAVNESLDRIHFHGLDVEMANLTVVQPNI